MRTSVNIVVHLRTFVRFRFSTIHKMGYVMIILRIVMNIRIRAYMNCMFGEYAIIELCQPRYEP